MIQVAEFDRARFLAQLEAAVAAREGAAAVGTELAHRQPKRLWFVGCGAPNKAMAAMKYWLERSARDLEVRLSYPAELVHQAPAALDSRTVAVLGSHSGTTPETVRAAEFLRERGVTTVGITQHAGSPLASRVDHPLIYGQSTEGFYAGSILLHALAGSLLDELEGWPLHEAVMTSLDGFPGALADAAQASDARAAEEARLYQDDRVLYTVGAGPCFSTAYVFGVCILMEMQWLHCHPVVAAEFFHGPFEVVDETTPLILLVGEDPNRPEAERVVRFCQRYGQRLMTYDSTEYGMPGIATDVRPIVAPFVLLAALERLAEHLAAWHDHPLTTRRYMGKVEY